DLFMIDSRRLELVGSCYDAGSVLSTVGVRGAVDYTVVHGKITVREGKLTGIDEDVISEQAQKKCNAYLGMQ
ncbi:MAG: 8-oxoguanine deaminase, partial [Clostridia bacterium]|nr:8-oxoguanine deaminase [Clostridia bacterium]